MNMRARWIEDINAGKASCIFSLPDAAIRSETGRGIAPLVKLDFDGKPDLAGEVILSETGRGIAPLAKLYINNKSDLAGAKCYDKVVGSAAAALLCDIGVVYVYAAIMSEKARDMLASAGIAVEYGQLVPAVLNGKRQGLCPLEARVIGLSQADAVCETLSFYAEVSTRLSP
ncbi:MAG: DUF1893 domain-containing protein [Clostridiaceae bacterium]|jgi:hypothetical protein|nr:DUF1893 domain-containing protein [Clostridiaceae bacterium]